MKRWGRLIALLLLMVVGLGILFYPTFSNWWNERRAAKLMTNYDQVVAEIDTSEQEEMLADARAFNGRLRGESVPDAFADRDPERDLSYEAVLDIDGSGMMGTVEVPCIDVKLPIFHYTTKEVLEKGAGHLAGSSFPVGGENAHCIISAHRGLPSAKLFTDLDRVKEEDVFYLHVLTETLAYEVDQIKVVEPSDTSDLIIEQGKDLCTLVTCTPYAVNSHRLLVRGHRIPYSEEQYEEESKNTAAPRGISVLIRILGVLAGAAIAGVIIFLMYLRRRRVAGVAAGAVDGGRTRRRRRRPDAAGKAGATEGAEDAPVEKEETSAADERVTDDTDTEDE